jgi:hypothetical protein
LREISIISRAHDRFELIFMAACEALPCFLRDIAAVMCFKQSVGSELSTLVCAGQLPGVLLLV